METNTNNAAISIIIPHWENIDGLEILLESIRQEACKHPNLSETIVVDDYSCPETQQKLRDLQNKFDFRLYFNNSIKSAGTCRNIGIEKSIGQWLLFADSDDYFLPSFLGATQKYFNSDYDIVFFPPTSVDCNNHNILSDRHLAFIKLLDNYQQNQAKELDLIYLWHAPWSRLIRKNIVTNNNIKFDSTLAANDVLFSTFIAFFTKKIATATITIYAITSRSNSLICNPTLEHWLARIDVNIRNNKFLTNHKLGRYKKSNWGWLLPILIHFGLLNFLKTMFYITSKGENPLYGLADKIAHSFITIKKQGFKQIATIIKKRRKHL